MYCTQCGSICENRDKVCTHCGEKLTDNAYGNYNNTYNPNSSYYMPYAYKQPYAGFWIRFVAAIIDAIILRICIFIGTFIFSAIVLLIIGIQILDEPSSSYYAGASIFLIGALSWICITWLYCAFFESSSYQATPGKMVVGIKVVDLEGNRLSFGRATGRFFSKGISTITMYIGYILAGITDKKQALHDMIAGTLVVNK